MADADGDGFSMGAVLSRTASSIGRNIAALGALAALMLAPGLLTGYALDAPTPEAVAAGAATGGYWLATTLSSLVMFLVACAAMKLAVADARGEDAGLVPALKTGLARFFPLLVLSLVYYVCFAFGLVLLIVPGVFLMTMWVLIGPVAVVEDGGMMASFGRSRFLTKGHRWAVFGLIMIAVVAYALVLAPFMVNIAALADIGFTARLALQTGSAAITLAGCVMVAALYIELVAAKEGPGQAELEQVFA